MKDAKLRTLDKQQQEAQMLAETRTDDSKREAAQRKFAEYSQEQVDEIFRAAALAANNARIDLAKMAVEETGMESSKTKSSRITSLRKYLS